MIADIEEMDKLKQENEHFEKYIKWCQRNHAIRNEIIKRTDSLMMEVMLLRSSFDVEKDVEKIEKDLTELKKRIIEEKERKPTCG